MKQGASRDLSDTRDLLLTATLAELDDKGFSKLRVDEVCRRAHRTSGAVYSAFGSKADLIAAALQHRNLRAANAAAELGDPAGQDESYLVVALTVLDRDGYLAAKPATVAHEAGTTFEELRKSFADKDDLFFAAIAWSSPSVRSALRYEPTDEPTPHSLSTTDRLIEATLAFLDDNRFPSVSVAEIARRAGLTTGAIYANYGSKEGLLNAALAERYEALFRAALERVGESDDTAGIQAALGSVLLHEAGDDHRALMEVLSSASRREPVHAVVESRLTERQQTVADLVSSSKASGRIGDDVPPDALAYVIQLIGLGNVVSQALGLPRPDPDDLQAVLLKLGIGLAGGDSKG